MYDASTQRPRCAAFHPTDPIAWLELRGIERTLAACGWGTHTGPPPVAPTTAAIAAGECVSLVGDRGAGVALLWCIGGIVRPSGGELRWLTGDGTPGAAPPRAFVGAGWQGYDFWTVRDTLESAVPVGTPQADADRRIEAAIRLCLGGFAPRAPVDRLGVPFRWLVGVCAAVVTGAHWLLLEVPAAAGADMAVRAGLRTLWTSGFTLLAAPHDAASAVLPGSRLLRLAPLQAVSPDAGAVRRVAELADRIAAGAASASPMLPRSVDLPPGAP